MAGTNSALSDKIPSNKPYKGYCSWPAANGRIGFQASVISGELESARSIRQPIPNYYSSSPNFSIQNEYTMERGRQYSLKELSVKNIFGPQIGRWRKSARKKVSSGLTFLCRSWPALMRGTLESAIYSYLGKDLGRDV